MSSIFNNREPWVLSYYFSVLMIAIFIGWITLCPSVLAHNQAQKIYGWISGKSPELIVAAPAVEADLSAHARNLIELYQIKKIKFTASIDLGTRVDILMKNNHKAGVVIPTNTYQTFYQIKVIQQEAVPSNSLPSQIQILAYQPKLSEKKLKNVLDQLDRSLVLIEKGLIQTASNKGFFDNEFSFGSALKTAMKSLWHDLIN